MDLLGFGSGDTLMIGVKLWNTVGENSYWKH